MKEQDEVTARDVSETDISNRSDGEFKATIIRILTGLEKRIEYISETLVMEIKDIKTYLLELKNTISKVGNRFDAMNSRLEKQRK